MCDLCNHRVCGAMRYMMDVCSQERERPAMSDSVMYIQAVCHLPCTSYNVSLCDSVSVYSSAIIKTLVMIENTLVNRAR